MYKSIALALIIFAALSACEQARTQEFYMTHPVELAADLAACREHDTNIYYCNEAEKAARFSKDHHADGAEENK